MSVKFQPLVHASSKVNFSSKVQNVASVTGFRASTPSCAFPVTLVLHLCCHVRPDFEGHQCIHADTNSIETATCAAAFS